MKPEKFESSRAKMSKTEAQGVATPADPTRLADMSDGQRASFTAVATGPSARAEATTTAVASVGAMAAASTAAPFPRHTAPASTSLAAPLALVALCRELWF